MNTKKIICTALLSASLFACGTAPAPSVPEAEVSAGLPEYAYMLDGQPVTLDTIKNVIAGGTHLTYFIPADWDGHTMQAYSTQAGVQAVKARQDQGMQAQGLCISWRTESHFFDGENYKGAELKVAKGMSYMDLSAYNINGKFWDEDISAVKAADCTYTYLYDWVNPNMILTPGQNLPAMPYPYNQGPGKSTIHAIAVL